MLKYFTVLLCRHVVGELKRTFCRNVFIKKCVFNDTHIYKIMTMTSIKDMRYSMFAFVHIMQAKRE